MEPRTSIASAVGRRATAMRQIRLFGRVGFRATQWTCATWSIPLPRSAIASTVSAGQTWIVWDGDDPIATITLTAYVDVDSLWKPDRDPEALWYRASSGLALVSVPLSGSVAVGITVDSVSAGYPGRRSSTCNSATSSLLCPTSIPDSGTSLSSNAVSKSTFQ